MNNSYISAATSADFNNQHVTPINARSAASSALTSFTADELGDRRAEWRVQELNYHRQINYQRPSNVAKDDPSRFHHLAYLEKGAITQPPDGEDVKVEGRAARCLTCIRYNRPCHGTGVQNGECETCRKLHGGKHATKRTCVWIDPSKDHWTYPAAHEARGGRQLPSNTAASRKKKVAEARIVKT